jgi:hypothetical protein
VIRESGGIHRTDDAREVLIPEHLWEHVEFLGKSMDSSKFNRELEKLLGFTRGYERATELGDELRYRREQKQTPLEQASARVASSYCLQQRVAQRFAQKVNFEDMVKKKKFINPESGKKVKFKSLPEEEQARIRKEFGAPPAEEDTGKGGGGVAAAKKFLGKAFSKINKKVSQPAVRTLGAGLGKAVGGLGNAIGKAVDRPPITKLITIGGSDTEYGEAKNYRMMGKVVGNMFAPGSFDMSPEEEKVGKQYLAASAQAYLPVLKGIGYSGAVKGILGAAGAFVGAPAIATTIATTAVGLAVGSVMYKIMDKGFTKYLESKCKKDKSKCKDFDNLTADIINGYKNIEGVEKEYEQKKEELKGDPQALHNLEEEWKKKQVSIDKAKGILKKYGADKAQEALKKLMTEMMTFAMTELGKGLEDGSLTEEFLEEIETNALEIAKKSPEEIEEEGKQWEAA